MTEGKVYVIHLYDRSREDCDDVWTVHYGVQYDGSDIDVTLLYNFFEFVTQYVAGELGIDIENEYSVFPEWVGNSCVLFLVPKGCEVVSTEELLEKATWVTVDVEKLAKYFEAAKPIILRLLRELESLKREIKALAAKVGLVR